MRHIHTSIVSRHLATRVNNKILCTPPPHTSSSEEIIPRLTPRTMSQFRTNISYLHKATPNHIHNYYAPSATPTHHIFNCTHIRTILLPLDLLTDPAGVTGLLGRWTEKLAGEPQAGRSDSPPLARVKGVGRQQQHGSL